MTQITIKVKNAALVKKNMQDLRAEIPKISRDRILTAMKGIVREMQRYPPVPSGSRYIRTNRLKNNWKIVDREKGYRLDNRTPYTRYVVGGAKGDGQAWMHVGRWLLLADVVEYHVSKLPKTIEEHITFFAKGKGL